MKSYITAPIKRQQTKQKLTSNKDFLSRELARAVEKPQPIITRLLAGGISLLFFGTLTWAAVSRVDEVATAQAEVIPSSRVQPVRALSGGLLREIKVKSGDQIRKGDPLIALDPTLSEAEYQRLKQLVKMKQQTLARLEAERSGQMKMRTSIQNQLLASRSQEFNARLDMAAAEARKQTGGIRAAQAELKGLTASLSVAKTKTSSMEFLSKEGAVPRFDYLDTQNQVATLESQIAAKEQEIFQAQQAYKAAQKEITRMTADRQKEVLTEIEQHQQELTSLTGQLTQAEEQRKRETLAAPIDGTVYNVKVVKTGATVQSGEELLSIVPTGEELVLEAKVSNQDIGFVRSGMRAKVKLATFPYQEFGMVEGTVLAVSPNSISEKDGNLIFPARIKLHKHTVRVKGREVQLTPGMVATAEIVTRQKTILSFLLEPISASWDKAFSIR